MANKKIKYPITRTKLNKLESEFSWVFLLGERANGKSYAVKSKCVHDAIKSNGEEQFIYLRRYESDCKDSLCVNYFADLPIYEMTNGKYDCIDVFRKGVYLANIDQSTGKITNRFKIGYCHALSIAERYKSLMFPKVKRIIFEEVVSMQGNYLTQNEPDYLQQYVSSIFRHRTDGTIYMIGNTISRICPYFRKFELENVPNMKLGQIDSYSFKNDDDSEVKLCVYRVESLNYNSGKFFGNVAKNITRGEYETQEQPHLPEPISHYDSIYKCVVKYQNFMFLCEFLKNKNDSKNMFWYITPKTHKKIKKRTRVISPEFNPDMLWTVGFNALTTEESYLFSFFDEGKVCFSDNLTGTEFKNVYNNYLH